MSGSSISVPNRANSTGVGNGFCDLERLVKLGLWTSRYWLLHEDGYAGEVLHNLHLNIAAGLEGSTEHRRGTDDNCTGAVFGGHVLDKVFERFEYARRLVRGYDEGVAFLLEHGSCSLDRGIDEGNDFKTQTEFTVVVQMANWVDTRGLLTVQIGKSGSMAPHRILV